jgi:hypothetical protein
MPTKRTPTRRPRRLQISDEDAALYKLARQADRQARTLLHRNLEVRPWQISPLDVPDPSWVRNYGDGWDRAIELRRQLEAALEAAPQ